MLNSILYSPGRLCNHILRAFVASFIASKQKLQFSYGQYYKNMCDLGIQLYTTGTNTYRGMIILNDTNFMKYIKDDTPLFLNINVRESFFQTKEFSNYLYTYYQQSKNRESIINANRFKERYEKNNDVFVHVRLGDVTNKNQGFAYYDKALSQINFENGYIASDSIDHIICQQLIKKYNLKPILYNEVETIMFGSTCKYVVLTGGSFSYIIGLFAFFSKVYYLKGFDTWYPSELFMIDDWTEITT